MDNTDTFSFFRLALLTALLALVVSCAPMQKKADQGPETAVQEPEAVETVDETDAGEGIEVVDAQDEVDEDADVDAPLTPEQEKAIQSEVNINLHLSVEESKTFLYYFKYYTGTYEDGRPKKGRKIFARWLKRSEQFLPYVRDEFRKRGLPEDLIFLPFAESGYNAWAYSWVGAGGMWQFMPYTGKHYGLRVDWWVDERRDAFKSTISAAEYLTKLHGMFDDWYIALAAYNAGEGKLSRAIKKSGTNDYFEIAKSRRYLKKETRHYVPKFMAILKIIDNLEELGFEPLDWDRGLNVKPFEVQGGTDLLALAGVAGYDWKEFSRLNPAFRRYVSPPDKTSTVYLPESKMQPVLAYLEKPGAQPYAGYQRYKVRSGDSWWRIARRSGVPISVLKKVNHKRSNLLRPGQYVMIPGKNSTASVASASTSRSQTRKIAAKRANYTVKSGDSLWAISKKFDVSVSTLRRSNGLSSSRIKPGQRLYIPDGAKVQAKIAKAQAETVNRTITYRVRRGDTIWEIARRYGVNPEKLLVWNNLKRTSVIKPGQKLKLHIK